MQPAKIFIYLAAVFLITFPTVGQAFWGSGSDNQSGLDLETGYDANTVTTVSGHVVSVQTSDERHASQLELEVNGNRSVVILGPKRYWDENGIVIKVGDSIIVSGSKAVGKDGIVYIIAQKVADISQITSVTLRNESGRPAWAGAGSGQGRMNSRPAQTPGRMGGGRMGR